MTAGCSESLFFLYLLLFILNFPSRRVECYTTVDLTNRTNASNGKFTYLVTNSISFSANNKTTPASTASNYIKLLTGASASTTTSPVQFIARTSSTPTSVTKRDCFYVKLVTHSSIAVQSNKSLVLDFDKCTGVRSSSRKSLIVGTNLLENLEACTMYRLHEDQKCSSLVQTSYKPPAPVADIRASVSNGVLNLTWHSKNSTANCISHYEVKLLYNTNLTTDFKSRVVAEYYTVSTPKPGKSYFYVTTVDVKGQKRASNAFEVLVRENSAVVTSRNTSVATYSQTLQTLCESCDDVFLNKSKKVTNAGNGSRAFDPCVFSVRELLWIGSQSVIMRVNFTCAASKCAANCCSYSRDGKCEPSSFEDWSATCTRKDGGGITISVTGGRLRRSQLYLCTVEATTVYKTYPQRGHFQTTDGRPGKPGRVWATNITPTSFLISWDPSPHVDKDPVDFYTLTVEPDQPNYRSRPDCQYPNFKRTFRTTNATITPQPVGGLLPYFMYSVYVTAHNTFGFTQSDSEKYCTQPSVPGICENASMRDSGVNSSISNPVYRFYWSEPCFWNAHPRDTAIRIIAKRPDNPKKTSSYEEHFNNVSQELETLDELLKSVGNSKKSMNSFALNASRDFVYYVEIFASVEKVPTMKECAGPWIITIPPGLSSVSNKWLKVRPEVLIPDEGGSPLVAIPLHQNLLDDTNGTIKHLAIMVAQKGQQGERERTFQQLPNWPNARSWFEAMTEDRVLLYQATPKYWSLPLFEDNSIHAFNLGSDNCLGNETYRSRRSIYDDVYDQDYLRSGSIASTSANASESEVDEVVYCNGPLKKNIEYVVRLRVFTSAGYTDSDDIYFRTGHTSSGWTPFYDQLWFYGIFPVFLASFLLSTMWIRKKRKWTNTVASAPSPDTIEAGGKPSRRRPCSRRRSISPQKLPVVAARLLAHRCTLEKEFEDLNEISAEWAAKVPCTVGLMKENRLKNRYADVVPYDYNRVKLSSESTSQTDYINASFVKGFTMDSEYIACQGPTVETSNDFWQMVFDQNVCFIVMLTSLVENGMAKCSQYFSELSENKEWMDFTVKCSSRLDLSNYTVRELQLYKRTNSEKRFIQHFQFRDWPDFGCPRDIDGILEFCDVLRGNLCLRGDSKTVVHCSAGIGRTGTLIALDILLQFVHYNRKIDIMRTVLRLREQRQWMVRTADQYAFIYRCLKTAAERHFSSES